MKEITIEETFQLLDMLLESNMKRLVVISVDSMATFDIILEYAKKKETVIKLRGDDLSGQLQPGHKLLLDYNMHYNSKGLDVDQLLNEVMLYDKADVSMVFLVTDFQPTDRISRNMEIYSCYNPDALTVGDVVDVLKSVDQSAIAIVRVDNGIAGFVSTSIIKNGVEKFVQFNCYTSPYTVASILQSLEGIDRGLVADFLAHSTKFAYAYEVNRFESQTIGKYSTIVVECESPSHYVMK